MKRALFASLLLLVSTPAYAVTVLTYDPTIIVQQTDNNPCFIGEPSCLNQNPPGFIGTLIPPNTEEAVLLSSVYTVSQLTELLEDTCFDIGTDINQAQETYTINALDVLIDGVVEYTFSGTIPTLNNGTGFSDGALRSVELSGFAGTSTVQFRLDFSNADNGREQFFLIPCEGETPIPEPASMALLLSSILGVPLLRKRRA